MSLATRVLIGLVAGLAAGLFFGESIQFVGVGGTAFILLLQMTVVPYIAVSLIAALGNLTVADAVDIAKRAGVFLVVFWGFALTAVMLMPLAFPDWTVASFFSSSLVESGAGFDPLELFIPANPFHSLAEAVVPSIVVFSIAMGLALMNVPGKQKILEPLATVADALGRITGFIVRLAPYGVFAILAEAAGTMQPEDVKGLEVYVVVFAASALVLALWAIPGLVALLTPFSYKDAVWYTRDALITAFATGNLFVVLAVLAEKTKKLIHTRKEEGADRASRLVDVVIPTAFTFPSAGKLLSLGFVLFAGWLSGFEVPLTKYPQFLAAGVASYFGATVVAIPFLLDTFQVPSDTFQLFLIADNVVGNRFGSLLAAMHILGLALLSACAVAGWIRIRPTRVMAYLGVTVVALLATVGGIRLVFESAGNEYAGYRKFIEMRPMFETVETRLVEAPPETLPAVDRTVPTLDRIRQRGFLRLGYHQDKLPYVFHNADGQLVGFDIDMANLLARELGVGLELVQIDYGDAPRLLNAGYLDTVIGGVAVTTDRLKHLSFPRSHMTETFAFIVRDHRRQDYSQRDRVKKLEGLRVAVPDVPYYVDKIRAYLPKAEVVPIRSLRDDFFRDETGRFDALAFTAETGSAWSLIYPQFSVAVPKPDKMEVPLAYPVARGDPEMVEFLSTWIDLKRSDGTIDRLFRHWILGEAAKKKEPRWSVIRDVLGWVD
jgi:Na+/H+-dicarboxylate symporter